MQTPINLEQKNYKGPVTSFEMLEQRWVYSASLSGEDCPRQNINKLAGASNTPYTDGGTQYRSHRFTETNYMMNFDRQITIISLYLTPIFFMIHLLFYKKFD